MQNMRISFIGAGNMATSLIGGLIARGLPASQIHASDPGEQRRQQLQQDFGIQVHADNAAASAAADVLVLAVKPQIMHQVCTDLRTALKPGQLVISIAAGIESSCLARWLEHQCIVRCMPNTPALLQQGVSGLFAAAAVSQEQKNIAEQILNAVGISVWLQDEQQLDAVTALSGSGPAYFFLLVEAMVQTGIKLGLDETTANQLARHTALGAARMLCESPLSASQLRQQVTSPQGTTDAAIRSFQQDGFAAMVERALSRAAERSAELAQQLGK